ncbi:PfkB family carbohydrate kinase [Aquirufa sp. HETE-83D]|uniref:PfkB family carbohydrate kinase n=1 Tax=Aquirufa esocilacus TaxID=3096513 RepID=A0ABW6DJ81_9BACT
MNSERLETLLARIQQLRIAVMGDFALDFYFDLQTSTNEFSLETAKEVHCASAPRTYLGGAGNVAKNLAVLGAQVSAFGVRGNDLFGREMLHQMAALGINATNIKETHIDTPTYSKPLQTQEELNRIDFGTRSSNFQAQTGELLQSLAAETFDWIIFNEQFGIPLLQAKHIEGINHANALADLRSLGSYAKHLPLKVNEAEFVKIHQKPATPENIRIWANTRNNPVLVTLGEKGMVYAGTEEFHHQPAFPVKGPIDTVGAGDMVVAGFSAARAAGASVEEACEFASLAVHISIHQLGETGSASPDAIRQLHDGHTIA